MKKIESINVNHSIDRFVDRSFDISDRIHEILERKSMTQRELADLLGKKESQVSLWLSGTHNFTIKTIVNLEVVLQEAILTVASYNPASVELRVADKIAEPDFSFQR